MATSSSNASLGSGETSVSSLYRKSFYPRAEHKVDIEGRSIGVEVTSDFPSVFAWDGAYELSSPYVGLLNHFGISQEERRCDFLGYYTEYEHSNSPAYVCPVKTIYKPALSVGKYHPQRSRQHRARSSDRAFDRFKHVQNICRQQRVKFDYLRFIVVTAPKAVSEQLPDPKLCSEFRAAVREFFHLLETELYRGQGLVGMRTIHIWGSEHPLEKHLHSHMVIGNVVYDSSFERWEKPHPYALRPDLLELGKFHRVNPFIAEKKLKEIWRTVLRNHDWWDKNDNSLPVVHISNVKFWGDAASSDGGNYADSLRRRIADTHKIRHRLSYMTRCPIEDINENLDSEWKSGFDEKFAWTLLCYTTSRSNLGFAANLKRTGYHSNISLLPKCPICGAELFKVGRVYSNLPDIVHLRRRNDGVWVGIPPPFSPKLTLG